MNTNDATRRDALKGSQHALNYVAVLKLLSHAIRPLLMRKNLKFLDWVRLEADFRVAVWPVTTEKSFFFCIWLMGCMMGLISRGDFYALPFVDQIRDWPIMECETVSSLPCKQRCMICEILLHVPIHLCGKGMDKIATSSNLQKFSCNEENILNINCIPWH